MKMRGLIGVFLAGAAVACDGGDRTGAVDATGDLAPVTDGARGPEAGRADGAPVDAARLDDGASAAGTVVWHLYLACPGDRMR